ncbi:hypothetical protein BD324DRAFT_644319 [Kockovaella imperatae]|uniref:Glycosyl transferase CAP10 domain-containing protein n=1 Tax=Kockovaella imperatae TaxID=4999 RepID=A0A1Y1UTC7_9TREE|nr:hypothetical protein BD324DRAFT_644319 [Kockovaella imperatae]ORX41279.1 hypothetical protein BD324DRAFT_644319 [Kockovaella imperatae]
MTQTWRLTIRRYMLNKRLRFSRIAILAFVIVLWFTFIGVPGSSGQDDLSQTDPAALYRAGPPRSEDAAHSSSSGWSTLFGRSKPVKKHPIELLIQRAEKQWEDVNKRQSKTLKSAFHEYQKRFGRLPPKGFDTWWKFCEQNHVKIRDDYDQTYNDVAPFFALSPETFRARAQKLVDTQSTYQLNLIPGNCSITGDRAGSARGKLLFRLIAPLVDLLPAPITFSMSDHDLGSWLVADDQRRHLNEAISQQRFVTEQELAPFEKRIGRVVVKGLTSACPEDSPGWQYGLAQLDGGMLPPPRTDEVTFLHDMDMTRDFCLNPSLLAVHGALSWDVPRDTILRPIGQLSKFTRNAEFLTTPLEAYENLTDPKAASKYTPWESKTVNKLFWRGSTTGDSYWKRDGYDWRNSHRPKLALMAQASASETNHQGHPTTNPKINVWVERGNDAKMEEWDLGVLNDRYMDVGLTGKPHQCREADGTCAEMAEDIKFKERISPEVASRFKYMLDVDGNGWSSRFHRLLTSGSVVLKASLYPEWNSAWLTPWYHYVPVQLDYSDLYSIMAFFVGPPDSSAISSTEAASGAGKKGHASPQVGHDDLAKQIALRGRQFGEEYWRWEDMQAYMLRLLLEYARLQADDRENWVYRG